MLFSVLSTVGIIWSGDTQGALSRVEVRPLAAGKHTIRFYFQTPLQNDRFGCFASGGPGYLEMTDANSFVDQSILNQALSLALTSVATGQTFNLDSQGQATNYNTCLNVVSAFITIP